MTRIYIEPQNASQSVCNEAEIAEKLNQLLQDVNTIRSSLRYTIAGREQISERLRQVAQQIEKESKSTKALSASLQQIVSKYEQTEASNRGRMKADKTDMKKKAATEDAIGSAAGWKDFDWGKLGGKTLETLLGPFGLIVDIPGLADGETGDLIKFLLDGVKGIAKVSGAKGDTTAEWLSDLFKLGPMEYESFGKTFLDKLGKFDTPAHTVGTVASWAGKLVDSIVKNMDEFSGSWCARFWEETVVEAGIKVAEGAAVTAGVSAATAAICAAVGVACPPALLVGVAAAGVGIALDWALDGIVSWATGGSCTSWVEGMSDIICNGIDMIREGVGTVATKTVETVKNVADAVVDTGKKVVNAVGDGINAIGNGIKNLFGGCKWAPCLF